MTLYELTQSALYLQQLLEDGEIDEQTFADSIESLMAEDKIESICKVIRNLESQVDACKAEEDRLAKKRRTATNGVQRLKDSLVNFLQVTDSKKVTSGLFTVSLRSSTSCEVTNEDEIPNSFLVMQDPKPNLTAIKDSIKQGIDVPGARLVQKPYVLIK